MDVDLALKMMVDVSAYLDKLEIYHVIHGASLLGLVRDGKLIEWDKDFDIGIMQHHVEEYFPLLNRYFVDNKYDDVQVMNFPYRQNRSIHATKNGVLCDLLTYDIGENGILFNVIHDQFAAMVYPSRFFLETKPMKVGGKDIRIPLEAESYLEYVYGKDWRIPNPEWKFTDYKMMVPGWMGISTEAEAKARLDKGFTTW